MTTTVSPATRDIVLRSLLGHRLYLACHGGPPGGSGAHEYSAAPYQRQPVSFVQRGEGMANTSEVRFIMPDAAVRWLGLWDAQNGGRFIMAADTQQRTLALGDTYVVPAGAVRIAVRTD